MKRPLARRTKVILIVLCIMFLAGVTFYLHQRPRPLVNTVKIDCHWFERGGWRTNTTTDAAAIDRITQTMSQGYLIIPLGKSRGSAVLTLTDAQGATQTWTLKSDGNNAMWGGDGCYSSSQRLEPVLREILPPLHFTTDAPPQDRRSGR